MCFGGIEVGPYELDNYKGDKCMLCPDSVREYCEFHEYNKPCDFFAKRYPKVKQIIMQSITL